MSSNARNHRWNIAFPLSLFVFLSWLRLQKWRDSNPWTVISMRGNLAMAMYSSRHAMNDMTDSFLLPHSRNERKQASHDSRDRRFSLLKPTVFTVVSRRSHKHITERDTKIHSFRLTVVAVKCSNWFEENKERLFCNSRRSNEKGSDDCLMRRYMHDDEQTRMNRTSSLRRLRFLSRVFINDLHLYQDHGDMNLTRRRAAGI